MATSSGGREAVEELAEEFVERYRRGERPSLTEYTAKYPEHAEEIRELFPALVIMERIAPGSDGTGSSSAGDSLRRRRLEHPERLGDYRVLREIGRGGMGVVYEAEQVSLGRHVALKVLPRQMLPDRKQRERFERESRAAARLHHTNIVPVFGVGEEGGLHYYVMQYIQGQGLDAVLDELRRLRDREAWPGSKGPAGPGATSPLEVSVEAVARSLLSRPGPVADGGVRTPVPTDPDEPDAAGASNCSPGDLAGRAISSASSIAGLRRSSETRRSGIQAYWLSVAQIAAQVAEALAHAHDAGVLHRDIKPANLLLDTRGNIWVTDFGLAKADGQQDLTNPGDIVGTLRYMAPERFEGHSDARGDIYALGATLYELLTLKAPFEGASRERLIERVLHQEPIPPRKRDARIPRDLEVICLKCLSKEPAHRYRDATELAAELRRFLAGEPIRARRVSALERGWRWCRRNRTVAALAALCVLAVILGFGGVTWMWRRAESNLKEADRQRGLVDRTRNVSLRQSAGLLLDRGIAFAEEGDAAGGLHWMLEALSTAPADAVELRRAIRMNLSAWRGQVHALRQIIRLDGPVGACAFTPDGARIAIASGDRLEFRDATTFRPTATPIRLPGPVDQLALTPDGRMLVVGYERGGVQRWDATTGKPFGGVLPSGGSSCRLALDTAGEAILIGSRDGTARIWDATTGEPRGEPFRFRQAVHGVAFAPDGRSVLLGTGDGTASLWDIATRARLAGPFTHQDAVRSVAVHPAGTTVLTGSWDETVLLWDRDTTRPIGPRLRHRFGLHQVSYRPDGAAILTVCSSDHSAYLWEASTGQRIGTPLWQPDLMRAAAISPDGRTVVTGGDDATARVWDIAGARSRPLARPDARKRLVNPGPEDEPWLPFYYLNQAVSFSPDRKAVVVTEGRRIARLWDTSTGSPIGVPLRHDRPVRMVAFSPDGRTVATASHDPTSGLTDSKLGSIRLWDAADGRPLGPPIWQHRWVSALAFSPDGRTLAAGDYGQDVRFWDAATGRVARPPIAQAGIAFSLAFSPDGKTLAAGTVEPMNGARLWDLETGRPIGEPMPHANWVVGVEFRPDGRALLTRSNDATARLWDARTARPLGAPMPHQGAPCAAFSPDGRRLATAGRLETEVKIRDAATGRTLPGATLGHAALVTALAFSPDGGLLGVGCNDGSARLWDVATARPLGPPMVQRSPIAGVGFTPDGRGFLTTAVDGTTRSWPVPVPMVGDPDRLVLRLQVLTGMRMDAGRHVEKLAADDWEERSGRLEDAGRTVDGAYASPVGPSAYHDARARDAEQDGDWFAARWHLDRLIDDRAAADGGGDRPDPWLLRARRARAGSAAGRFDAADADYRRAEELASRALVDAWYRQRIADCERAAQWRTALWYLDRCLAAAPRDAELYAIRARILGRLGRREDQVASLVKVAGLGAEGGALIALADEHAALADWGQAAVLYDRARRQEPVAPPAWIRGALVALEAGPEGGYRAMCVDLLEQAPRADAPEEADFVARICTLAPGATDDLAPVVELAERAVKQGSPSERPDFVCTLGAVLYRAGRFPEALARLEQAIAAKQGNRAVRDRLFLAMAQHRLGRAAEAARTFDEATRRTDGDGAMDRPPSWADRVEYGLLRREAEAMILGPSGHR